LHGDLTGLPPLLIQVGDAEVLLDDSTRLADRARSAGVDVTLEVWPEMVHVFQASAGYVPEADEAIAHIAAFCRPRLGLA
jgi:acetyl esterase/lipase